MRIFSSALLLCAAGLLLAPNVRATIVTFSESGINAGFGPENLLAPGGTVITTQYSSEDVDFFFPNPSSGEEYVSSRTYMSQFAGDGGASNQYLAVDTTPSFSSTPATLVAAFTTPVLASSIQFDIADTEAMAPTVTFFDPSGKLIAGLTWINTNFTAHVSFTTASGLIGSIHFTDTGSRGFTLDNLQFLAINIPESAPWALGLGGLAAMALLRLRARRQVRA
jgi:hypothetical protein